VRGGLLGMGYGVWVCGGGGGCRLGEGGDGRGDVGWEEGRDYLNCEVGVALEIKRWFMDCHTFLSPTL